MTTAKPAPTADRDALAPGDGVVNRHTGAVRILDRRKDTGDGWWLADGGGLADRVFRTEWISAQALVAALEDLTRENERLRAERAGYEEIIRLAWEALGNEPDDRPVMAVVEQIRDLCRQVDEHVDHEIAFTERAVKAERERDAIGARALDTLIEGGRCARRALRAEAKLAAVRAELDHAFLNDHVLDRDCQSVAPGERVPAVRIDFLLAALDGAGQTEGERR